MYRQTSNIQFLSYPLQFFAVQIFKIIQDKKKLSTPKEKKSLNKCLTQQYYLFKKSRELNEYHKMHA